MKGIIEPCQWTRSIWSSRGQGGWEIEKWLAHSGESWSVGSKDWWMRERTKKWKWKCSFTKFLPSPSASRVPVGCWWSRTVLPSFKLHHRSGRTFENITFSLSYTRIFFRIPYYSSRGLSRVRAKNRSRHLLIFFFPNAISPTSRYIISKSLPGQLKLYICQCLMVLWSPLH